MMQSGLTSFKHVGVIAFLFLFLAFLIGIYFFYNCGWLILLFMFVGFISVCFYTTYLAKWLLGEALSGISLGFLVVIGSYYVITGHITADVLLLAIPPGILTFLLLLLNEIPDADADRVGGRYHLVIWLGKKKSVYLYATFLCLLYAIISVLPIITNMSRYILLALFTLPLAILAFYNATKYLGTKQFQKAQGLNVAIVILTDILLAIGCLIR